ncbi:hypothetical protein [Pedobacter xixiisoli]|uniref:Uncharacterized protein n=1 Tax=Pedobacter xixiisoli TaxID=1476464 RepID=A0A285ZUJ4_9SPHI|nr:hypothetical protein [Pedobacter xixiisoli]SOD13333.1 hypothetical protein SAMN06297358_1160 [Pedobacter xixiisoli]
MKAIINLLIVFLLIGTEASAQQVLMDTAFMQPYDANNYDKIDGFFDKGKSPERSTINKSTLVYSLPNLKSKQVGDLEAFTPIVLLKEGIHPETKHNWIKIKYDVQNDNGRCEERQGYIINKNLSIGNLNANLANENLAFILSKSPLLDADLKKPRFRLNAVHRFTDLNYKKVKSVSSYDLSIGAVDYYNHFYLAGVYNNALKQMPNLLRLYWHHGESCPESEGNVFIAYANGKMSEIINASSTGEGGFYESTKVYIPLKFNKGKILLVENGDSENMLDSYNGTSKTIPYPKDCGIPIEQLVVVIEEDAEGKTDAEGNFIEDKYKETVMVITHKIIRYYRWTGSKLQEVKKVVVKQRKEN